MCGIGHHLGVATGTAGYHGPYQLDHKEKDLPSTVPQKGNNITANHMPKTTPSLWASLKSLHRILAGIWTNNSCVLQLIERTFLLLKLHPSASLSIQSDPPSAPYPKPEIDVSIQAKNEMYTQKRHRI